MNAEAINKARVKVGEYASTDEDGLNGMFLFVINNLRVKCIVSEQEGWKHVSVSIYGCTIPPSWTIMQKVKELFWDDESWVVQYHPAKSQYINYHPGVLHLWEPLGVELPKPPKEFV